MKRTKSQGIIGRAAVLLLTLVLAGTMTGCGTALAVLSGGEDAAATPEPTPAATPLPVETPAPTPTAEPSIEPLPTAAPPEPETEGVEITEDNYRTLFAPAPGFDYIGVAYVKAPPAYGSFVDAYLPYGSIEYLKGGYAVRSAAHGMMVYETMIEEDWDDTAEDAVDELLDDWEDMAEDAREEVIDISDVQYFEEYDVAVQAVYAVTPDGNDRVTVLYADTRGGGYYFGAMITYMPEQYDGEQPALLAELQEVFGFELP